MPPDLRGRSAVYTQLWWIVQSTLFGLSPQAFCGWRRWLLRLFGANIGKGVFLRPSVRVTYPWKLKVGNHCHIGDEVVLYTLGEIEIGDCAASRSAPIFVRARMTTPAPLSILTPKRS